MKQSKHKVFSPFYECKFVVETTFPCWSAFAHPWTAVKDGSSLVAACEFAKMDFL